MDIQALRLLTQSRDGKKLKAQSAAMVESLEAAKDLPKNVPALWANYMIGLAAACLIEGWSDFGMSDEAENLIAEFESFCQRAYEGRWFTQDKQLVEMMEKVLVLERQRLTEDGFPPEMFEHSFVFRYQAIAFKGKVGLGDGIYELPVTPEG